MAGTHAGPLRHTPARPGGGLRRDRERLLGRRPAAQPRAVRREHLLARTRPVPLRRVRRRDDPVVRRGIDPGPGGRPRTVHGPRPDLLPRLRRALPRLAGELRGLGAGHPPYTHRRLRTAAAAGADVLGSGQLAVRAVAHDRPPDGVGGGPAQPGKRKRTRLRPRGAGQRRARPACPQAARRRPARRDEVLPPAPTGRSDPVGSGPPAAIPLLPGHGVPAVRAGRRRRPLHP